MAFNENREALIKSYKIFSPYSDKSFSWEFESQLAHLNLITSFFNKNEVILDAGCGKGILDLALKMLGYNIEGIDSYLFEEGNSYTGELAELRKIWEKHGLIVRNRDLYKPDKKYDAVISVAVFEHQFNPFEFAEAMNGWLKNEKSKIYIGTPNIVHLLNRFRFLLGRPPVNNIGEFKNKNFVGHFREYTLSEMKYVFERSGFRIIKALNIQTRKPRLKAKDIFKLAAYLIPRSGDTNIILAEK